MPLTLPPFGQFQGQLVPLRGLWNRAPSEGDYFVNIEIDWASYLANNQSAVQVSLSGNSPVALSQIVALYIDNRRCGVDCDFQFPDSGFLLTVPTHAQGLFPVLTNALQFYVIASGAAASDITIVQVLNSLPPPIPLVPSQQQNNAAVNGVGAVNGTTQLVPNTVSGTLNTLSLSVDLTGAGNIQLAVIDGTGATVWANFFTVPAATTVNYPIELSGLAVRFKNGLQLVVSGATVTGGAINANSYYTTP